MSVPPDTLVPPSWCLTTSTVCSDRTARVCCAPLPILGFAAFPTVVAWFRPVLRCKQLRLVGQHGRGFPAARSPLEEGSSPAAVSASPPLRCPRGGVGSAFTAAHCPRAVRTGFRAFLRERVWEVPIAVASSGTALSFHGLLPPSDPRVQRSTGKPASRSPLSGCKHPSCEAVHADGVLRVELQVAFRPFGTRTSRVSPVRSAACRSS
jgi:hypothetical protein